MLCDLPSTLFQGGAWNQHNDIVFSSGNELYGVPAAGGTPALLATPSPPLYKSGCAGRSSCPMAAGIFIRPRAVQPTARAVWLKSLDSDETTQLLLAESNAAFAPPHFLLFTRQRTLVAQRFDVSTLKLVGEPSPIVDDVLLAANGRAAFGVSDAGVLAYRTGEATRSLVWVDRSGKVSDPIGALSADTADQAVPRRHTCRLSPADRRRCRRCVHLRHRTEGDIPTYQASRYRPLPDLVA